MVSSRICMSFSRKWSVVRSPRACRGAVHGSTSSPRTASEMSIATRTAIFILGGAAGKRHGGLLRKWAIDAGDRRFTHVIPAYAGIQAPLSWMPAFAVMTAGGIPPEFLRGIAIFVLRGGDFNRHDGLRPRLIGGSNLSSHIRDCRVALREQKGSSQRQQTYLLANPRISVMCAGAGPASVWGGRI